MDLHKINLTSVYPSYYNATQTPNLLQLEPINYLQISGIGHPDHALFQNSLDALYSVANGIVEHSKKMNREFEVPTLEGVWSLPEGEDFNATPKELWQWTLKMRMPDFILPIEFQAVQEHLTETNELILQVRFVTDQAQSVVQALHIGSYEAEEPTIERIKQYIDNHQLQLCGNHQEVYLTDPKTTELSQLMTIIKYPVTTLN